jgi:hypothetical protein
MKKLIMLTLIAAMVMFLSVSVTKAADPNAPKTEPVTIKGRVVATEDSNGVITAVYLHSKLQGRINITLDAMGKELGEKMKGKMVEVTGTETATDGEKWLTVEKYAEVQKPAEKPTEPAEEPKE